jgi:CheY-like chemotaxis protein
MYVQYIGVDKSESSRIYTFHVINPPQEARDFAVKVRSEEFSADRLKFQDGPGICSARLQRELQGETQEARAHTDLCIEDQDVREFRAQNYPHTKSADATDRGPRIPSAPPPHEKHFQNRGYWPLGSAPRPVSEEISVLLLHELGESLDALKSAMESESVKVCSVRSLQEALPLVTGPNPPHLVFTQPKLPDGIWVDVVNLAKQALKPVNIIVVARPVNAGLYLQAISGGAFDFIVAPLTGYQLNHVLRCAIESVLSRREAAACAAA